MTTGRFRQPIWIVPLAIAGLVAVAGWWGDTRLRQTLEAQLKAQLTVTLDANVTALDIWMTNQTQLAGELADDPKVRALACAILERPMRPGGPGQPPPGFSDLMEFDRYLRPRLGEVKYDAAELVKMEDTNFVVVANTAAGGFRFMGTPVSEAHTNDFARLFASGEPVIITPYKPEPPRFFGRGRRAGPPPPEGLGGGRAAPPRRGGTNGLRSGRPPLFTEVFRPRRGDRSRMQVAAPLRNTNGAVLGALALVIDPDKEFTRILSVAQPGASGETYAFDQHGLLISKSRFDDQLRKLGLLDVTNTSSALNLRLLDPGGDLLEGYKRLETNAAGRTLTAIVEKAVQGEDGVDVEPTRDYRGVPVVGAWRWLPEHGFGVATQMDAAEAFRPLRLLQWIFVSLFLLLVLCAFGMFLFSYRDIAWRKRLSEAELKLKQLGQYMLEEKVGEGGMGVVYRARHALLRRDTAVKLLLPERTDAASIQRFEREVCLTSQLAHPNTIQIYDYGHTPEGVFYYAMEYLRGLNAHDLVGRYGPQPEGRVIHILAQVCESLAEAHGRGLVHRDIKPANIFLCDRGGVPDCVKVLDFGLVREYGQRERDQMNLTGEKAMVGTPWFMPPEAIKDAARSDPRSDIYAVGALGYYLLTGQFVFNVDSVLEIYEKQITQTPVPPSQRSKNPVSRELERLILSCLDKDPERRPQTVTELRALLVACPRAADWAPEARAAWWTDFHSKEQQAVAQAEATKQAAPAATVKIDFATRIK